MKANSSNHYGYNKNLLTNARALRGDMTKAEACLWKYALKAGQMEGYTFRRQRPVLRYIADFMCIRLKLIIEVDGRSHTVAGARERDEVRQRALESAGFRVLRFTDGEVLNEMGWVKGRIAEEIRRIVGTTPRPLLSLAPSKEGESLPLTPSKEGEMNE